VSQEHTRFYSYLLSLIICIITCRIPTLFSHVVSIYLSFCAPSTLQIADKLPYSVLPPPPRYPSQAAYNLAVANGQAAPMIETNNLLTHPTGPEYQLVVGEGVYKFVTQDGGRLEVLNLCRYICPEGRSTPCDTSPSSVRSTYNKSESSCDHASACDNWNKTIALVTQFAPCTTCPVQDGNESKWKVKWAVFEHKGRRENIRRCASKL